MQNKINNANIEVNANIYFDGAVTSRTVYLESGEKITLGIMMPGEYTFDTAKKEIMEIASGELDILLPGDNEWKTINAPETFEVPANSSFSLKVTKVTDYLCRYV